MSLSPLAAVTLAVGLLGYAALCRQLRYSRREQKHKQFPYKNAEDLARMTVQDAYEITSYLSQVEFPFTIEKALEFALFKTYGIPSISKLLLKTTQLSSMTSAPRRYCDTSVLLREFTQNPPDSERANSAIARMNWLHARYRNEISNDDLLYTLGLFITEPDHWIGKYEWRPLTPMELCAMGTFWKSVGDAMKISYSELPSYDSGFKDGLQFFNEINKWCSKYEERYMLPTDTNAKVAGATVNILLWNIPEALKPFARHAVSSLLEDRLRIAMMFPPPPAWIKKCVLGMMRTRQFLLGYLALPRPWILRKRTITDTPDENGRYHLLYWVTEPFYLKATFWNRFGPLAMWARLIGRPPPTPGAFKCEGYRIEEVGPEIFVGKGLGEHEKMMKELMSKDHSKCPFS